MPAIICLLSLSDHVHDTPRSLASLRGSVHASTCSDYDNATTRSHDVLERSLHEPFFDVLIRHLLSDYEDLALARSSSYELPILRDEDTCSCRHFVGSNVSRRRHYDIL